MRFIVWLMSKLVLVADTPWVINSVSSALAAEDWEVEVCQDPREAVKVVSDTQPTAVIADLQVGSKGGMAVIRAIRQLGSPRPRLVMLLDRSADSFLSGRAGADAFVLKPIESDELRRALSGEAGRTEEE
jgi:DNA-binding response OmpR family regulator